jgi:hypothetical protein
VVSLDGLEPQQLPSGVVLHLEVEPNQQHWLHTARQLLRRSET